MPQGDEGYVGSATKEVRSKTKPRIEEFELALTRLNLDAYPTLPGAKPTKELAEALKYVS